MNSKLENRQTVANTDYLVKSKDIPGYIVDGAARATLHALRRYFDLPNVKREYEEWKRNQQSEE